MHESLTDRAQEKLGEALAEQVSDRESNEPRDPENRKYLLRDLNSLLTSAGPGAELQPHLLNDPTQLRRHLQASLEIPAQVLARELPERLAKWLAEEPPRQDQVGRRGWAAKGRWLLDQARLNQLE